MKIFFDCEFTGLHQKTTLISIGFVSEDGKTFYAELNDFDITQVDDWILENVIDNLKFFKPGEEGKAEYYVATRHSDNSIGENLYNSYSIELRCNKNQLKKELTKWLSQFKKQILIWSDCLAYDWVLFNDIFGHAFEIPKNVYYIPFDICTLFKIKGIDPDISREEFINCKNKDQKHNALFDAIVIKECFQKLYILPDQDLIKKLDVKKDDFISEEILDKCEYHHKILPDQKIIPVDTETNIYKAIMEKLDQILESLNKNK